MNFADFSLRKSTITWFLTILIVFSGIWAYGKLGKLEDPSFTIKTAAISTPYPGASPREVEEEVTSLIESAAQKLGQTDKVRSLSKEGLSLVYVDIKDTFTAKDLPQIWDELRRKITDVQSSLPLSIMGLTPGLLVMGKSFDFLALPGFLSLAGMLIKNAIVLIDQIDIEIREGKAPFDAILDSGVSRCRPVMMAALTTVLGMVPLYFDVLFSAMAVTIMFGLSFATVLTLVVVPVLYGETLKA